MHEVTADWISLAGWLEVLFKTSTPGAYLVESPAPSTSAGLLTEERVANSAGRANRAAICLREVLRNAQIHVKKRYGHSSVVAWVGRLRVAGHAPRPGLDGQCTASNLEMSRPGENIFRARAKHMAEGSLSNVLILF